MEEGLVFWEKYFKSEVEVTWDEFATAFVAFIQNYGHYQLDQEQVDYLKQLIDPDYRNIIRVANFLIFYDNIWRIQSYKMKIFKHQFEVFQYNIPFQKYAGIKFTIKAIAVGYQKGDRDFFLTRETWQKTSIKDPQQIQPELSYVSSMHIVQTPTEEFRLKKEEVFLIGNNKEKADFCIEQDLQINPEHLKIVWSPYNLFLIKDISKSFRTSFKILPSQIYQLDYQMVVKLGPDTSFFVKFVNPLASQKNNAFYIETAQENTENYFPYLLKQLQTHRFSSVEEYRKALDAKKIDTPNANLFKKSEHKLENTLIIEFLEGPLKGQQFKLDSNEHYTLGKSHFCNIRIPDRFVQNEQVLIKFSSTLGWTIEIVESKKQSAQVCDQTVFGTFILLANYNQLHFGMPSRAHVLQENIAITVGPYLLQANYIEL